MSFFSWLKRVFLRLSKEEKPIIQTPLRASVSLNNAELNNMLFELANSAWTEPRTPEGFFLDPRIFGKPSSIEEIERAFGFFYTHAGMWCPGLSTPAGLPHVTVSLMDEGKTIGQYSHDGKRANVTIARSILSTPLALLATMAHEACHHILDLSSLNDPDRTQNERKTDLAMYVCGFGEIAQSGYRSAVELSKGFSTMHIGYLRPEEHDYATAWTLHHREKMAKGTGLIVQQDERLYKKLLVLFQGDKAKIERWVAFVQKRQPNLSISEVYKWIIEDHQRANR
jgi:hypothetical protein